MKNARRRAGQIVIPALFIFPSLMLFVYLIFETAKLSREKIRHQFALDAAAFVEMTNYSDFLNRTAYVNGPFPMRIFEEGFKSVCIDCDMKRDCKAYPPCSKGKSVWDILWENGAFPRDLNDKANSEYKPSDKIWDVGFNSGRTSKQGQDGEAEETLDLLRKDDADMFWINWDDANNIYKLYVQIYQLLGSVEEAQWSVLTRLTEKHSFFKKSYWLNTGDPIAEADLGARDFDNAVGVWNGSVVTPKCHKKINFWGNKPTGSAFQPWQLYRPQEPVQLPVTIQGCGGLFAVMTVKPSVLNKLQNLAVADGKYNFAKAGIGIKQPWTAPGNYFNYDFNTNAFAGGRPFVHVTVGLGPYGRVWPNPTPKFQVRTYP
jgi:hypothetical protein